MRQSTKMSEIFMKIKFKMARIVPAPFKVFTPFVAFVVTGCVSVANYRTNLQTWVGQSEQVLEETWGGTNLYSTIWQCQTNHFHSQ